MFVFRADDGYYEDMYPAPDDDATTAYRPQTAIALDLLRLDDDDDAATIDDDRKQLTRFDALSPSTSGDAGSSDVMRMSPLPAAVRATSHMYTNLVFDVRPESWFNKFLHSKV